MFACIYIDYSRCISLPSAAVDISVFKGLSLVCFEFKSWLLQGAPHSICTQTWTHLSQLWLFLFSMYAHAHTCETFTCMHITSKTHSDTMQTPIQHKFFLRGIHNQSSRLESLSTTSDVTSACSVSCSSPTPFLFPPLFHQLNPSFDTSEGAPYMPVTSLLLHRCFLLGFLSRARVSVWNLCTL